MKEHPILFSGPMVRTILSGQKQQTRRVVNFKEKSKLFENQHDIWKSVGKAVDGSYIFWDSPEMGRRTSEFYNSGGYKCPYGVPGDRLWVRETFVAECWEDEPKDPADHRPIFHHEGDGSEWDEDYWLWPHYKATDPKPELVYENDENDDGEPKCKWIPSIYMPRWASRITLEVLNVRVERLQDITHEDAVKEGFPNEDGKAWGRLGFSLTWEKINGPGSWKNNPWVWVIEFCMV